MMGAAMGRRGRPTAEVVLTDDERERLERWARRPKSAQALAFRCRIVLGAADGDSNKDIAARLGCNPTTVGKWRNRFANAAWMVSMTSPARASRARSGTMTSSV